MTINQFFSDVETVITGLTPNYLEGISFKKAPDNMPLESMDDSAESTDRSFQIRFGSVSDVSQFNCDGFSIKTEMFVLMRYYICHKDDNKYIEANIMSAEDARQIVASILHPTQNYNSSFYGVTFVDDSGLLETDNDSIFFRQLKFVVDSADSLGIVAAQTEIPQYSTYDEVYAYLVAQGSSTKENVPLYKKGFEGDSTKIICYFGYNSVGYIVPTTDIDFTLVTDGGFGSVSAIVDSRKLTLANGHTVPSRKPYTVRVIQLSTGTEIYNGTATCMGNTLTLTSTTGISANDLIYVDGRSEFSIGNSTRNIQLGAGSVVRFANGLVMPTQTAITRFNFVKYWGWFSVYLDASTVVGDNQYDGVAFGHSNTSAQYQYGGFFRYIASSFLRGGQVRHTTNAFSSVNGPTSITSNTFLTATRLNNFIPIWSVYGNSQTIAASVVLVNPGMVFESKLVNSSAKILKLSVKEYA